MYVVGVMADLEYSLRAVAAATQKATFGVASAERAVRMKQRLIEIQQLVNDPLIQPALDAVATVELRVNNREALNDAADKVGKAAYEFAEKANGDKLAAIDPLLPKPTQTRIRQDNRIGRIHRMITRCGFGVRSLDESGSASLLIMSILPILLSCPNGIRTVIDARTRSRRTPTAALGRPLRRQHDRGRRRAAAVDRTVPAS